MDRLNAGALFTSLLARGLILETDGKRIGVTPANALTEADRVAIRACKLDLIGLLTDSWSVARLIGRLCEDKRIDLATYLEAIPNLHILLNHGEDART